MKEEEKYHVFYQEKYLIDIGRRMAYRILGEMLKEKFPGRKEEIDKLQFTMAEAAFLDIGISIINYLKTGKFNIYELQTARSFLTTFHSFKSQLEKTVGHVSNNRLEISHGELLEFPKMLREKFGALFPSPADMEKFLSEVLPEGGTGVSGKSEIGLLAADSRFFNTNPAAKCQHPFSQSQIGKRVFPEFLEISINPLQRVVKKLMDILDLVFNRGDFFMPNINLKNSLGNFKERLADSNEQILENYLIISFIENMIGELPINFSRDAVDLINRNREFLVTYLGLLSQHMIGNNEKILESSRVEKESLDTLYKQTLFYVDLINKFYEWVDDVKKRDLFYSSLHKETLYGLFERFECLLNTNKAKLDKVIAMFEITNQLADVFRIDGIDKISSAATLYQPLADLIIKIQALGTSSGIDSNSNLREADQIVESLKKILIGSSENAARNQLVRVFHSLKTAFSDPANFVLANDGHSSEEQESENEESEYEEQVWKGFD